MWLGPERRSASAPPAWWSVSVRGRLLLGEEEDMMVVVAVWRCRMIMERIHSIDGGCFVSSRRISLLHLFFFCWFSLVKQQTCPSTRHNDMSHVHMLLENCS